MKLGNFRHGQDCAFHHHTWGYIAGAAITVGGSILSAPKAPKTSNPIPTNLQDEQAKAIGGNLANQGSIENLISRGNSFTQDQAISLQEKAMPGYTDLAKTLTSRAQTLAANPYDVPKEVQDNLSRIAAEKGISAGTRGQFNDFSLLRDLGVNQLQYGQSNIAQAQSLTGLLSQIAPKVNPMSPLSFYITPTQQAAITGGNNAASQAVTQGAFNAQAAADNAGRADLWGSLAGYAMQGASKIGKNGQQPSGDPSVVDMGTDTVGALKFG